MEERIIRLEDQVGFVRSDASDIKASVRLLDIKIESARDALQSLDKSGAKLSATVDRIDDKVGMFESRMDRFEDAITTRIDEKTSALAVRQDHTERTLTARIDEKNAALSARFDQTDKRIDETKATLTSRIDETKFALTSRIDETKAALIERDDAVFDRKFFRATGMIFSGGPAMYALAKLVEGMSLGTDQVIGISIGVSVLMCAVVLLVTRRSPSTIKKE